MPEYQCAVKREAKKAQKEKDRPGALGSPDSKDADLKPQQVKGSRSDVFPPSAPSAADSRRANHNRQVLEEKSVAASAAAANGSAANGLVIKPLSPEQEELINRLVYFQEEFDQPSEEDLRKISVSHHLPHSLIKSNPIQFNQSIKY